MLHISERDWELGKNYPTELALRANVKETLRALLPLLRARRNAAEAEAAERRLAALAPRNWSAQRGVACAELMRAERTAPIDPRYLMLAISETLPQDAIVVEEALTSSASLPGLLELRDRRATTGSPAAASASPCPARWESAWRSRGGRCWRSSATAARCTACRRCGPRRT